MINIVRRPLALARLVLLIAGSIGIPTLARAHDVPQSVVLLDVGRSSIETELQLPLSELGLALGLPLTSNPDTATSRYRTQIEDYVNERWQLHDDRGRSYATLIESMAIHTTDNPNWISNAWLILHLRLQAPAGASTEKFSIDDSVILQRVLSHQMLIYVRRDLRNELLGDQPQLIGVLGFGKTHLQVDGSDGNWWKGFSHLFVMGMHHIADGSDHLLFLLMLLLPAPLIARAGKWRGGKGTVESVVTIAKTVSGFTLGHCITLALGAAGLVTVPGQPVEALIAVSIIVSALHAWNPLFSGKETYLAAGFGLIHGLAFATALSGLNFDGLTLGLSLLGFNLGIEAMQLAVIVAVMPWLLLLSRTRAYPSVRMSGAVFGFLAASAWLLERITGRSNTLGRAIESLASHGAWAILLLAIVAGVVATVERVRKNVWTAPSRASAGSQPAARVGFNG